VGITLDSGFANKAWTDQLGASFPVLSDWGGDTARKFGIFNADRKIARRATFLIDKSGKVVEVQLDKEAADPNYVVTACERHRISENAAK